MSTKTDKGGAKRRKTSIALAFLGLSLIVLCGLVSAIEFYSLDGPSEQQGSRLAEPLLSALADYKQQEGKYPPTLQYLVPKYIANIPKPAWRYDYIYYPYPSSTKPLEYALWFKLRNDADDWYCYQSRAGQWERHDSVCQLSK